MGFHVCEFCPNGVPVGKYPNTSSGDVTLTFPNGRSWQMPDMILHYIDGHRYQPPMEFIDDVMDNEELKGSSAVQTRGASPRPIPVGYLKGGFPMGNVPAGFAGKLQDFMEQANRDAGRPKGVYAKRPGTTYR